MSDTIRTILEELYALEPELKEHEAELALLVKQLIELKPDVKASPAFVAELKLKLAQREKELMSENQPADKLSAITKVLSLFSQPYMLAGVAIAIFALVLVSSLPSVLRRSSTIGQFTSGVVRLEPGAFGSLSSLTDISATGLGAGPVAASQAPAADASGMTVAKSTATAETKLSAPAGFGGGVAIDRPLIYQPYDYRYSGEPVTDLPTQAEVIKRLKNIGLPVNSSFLNSFELGNLNLNSFSGASLSQVTLVEDKEFGYMVSVDFLEGSINIFENWRRWPNPYNDCRDEACYRSLQMNIENVPADETIIAMASTWLDDHGISPEGYGQPFVQNEWRVYYDQAADKSQAFVPDIITVIFPFLINGQPVYEYGGNQAGLGVNVNLRYSRVSGVWNLLSQRYQASSYEAESDFETLLKYAMSGNQGYPMPLMYPVPEGENRELKIELGAPTMGYLRYWNYLNNENQELYLPALVFPVLNPLTEAYAYLPKNIVVPLIKEYLQSSYPGDGPVRIMPAAPMTEPGAGASGSAGASAGTAVVEPAPAVLPNQ